MVNLVSILESASDITAFGYWFICECYCAGRVRGPPRGRGSAGAVVGGTNGREGAEFTAMEISVGVKPSAVARTVSGPEPPSFDWTMT